MIQITKICVFLVISIAATMLQAQDTAVPDNQIAVIQLKSGTKVEGEIIDWSFGEYITIKLAWGKEHTFMQHQIRKISQKSALRHRSPAPYSFKDTGLYIAPRVYAITGNNGNRANGVWGLGGSLSAGHRFNRLLSVGAGFGYDRYIWRSGENFIPLFAEVSGFMMPTNRSLFYNLQLGYGFVFTDDDYLLTEAQGGLMVYPNIGYSWGPTEHKMGVSLGYKFQNANLTYSSAWNFGERSEQDILFKRLTIAFSIWY